MRILPDFPCLQFEFKPTWRKYFYPLKSLTYMDTEKIEGKVYVNQEPLILYMWIQTTRLTLISFEFSLCIINIFTIYKYKIIVHN